MYLIKGVSEHNTFITLSFKYLYLVRLYPGMATRKFFFSLVFIRNFVFLVSYYRTRSLKDYVLKTAKTLDIKF